MPNKNLLGTEAEDYYPKSSSSTMLEVQLLSVESFMSAISQVELKEKTRHEVAREQMESELQTLRALSAVSHNLLSLLTSFKFICFPFNRPGLRQFSPPIPPSPL